MVFSFSSLLLFAINNDNNILLKLAWLIYSYDLILSYS